MQNSVSFTQNVDLVVSLTESEAALTDSFYTAGLRAVVCYRLFTLEGKTCLNTYRESLGRFLQSTPAEWRISIESTFQSRTLSIICVQESGS